MAIKRRMDYVLQEATAVGDAGSAVQMGGVIDVAPYDTITIFIDYTKGTESGVLVYANFFRRLATGLYQLGEWTLPGGAKTFQETYFQLTASDRRYITLDVTGQNLMTLHNVAIQGAVSGTMAASILLTEEGM